MAVVTAPLHSQSASGQFGKTLIYQPSRGQNVVRAYGKPNWVSHPATAPQLAVQAFTKLIMEHWEVILPVDQATWDALAEPANISRINAYCTENWRRHRADEPLLDAWPDINSTLTAAIVTAGYPAPDPDCTGDYTRIAEIEGFHAYRSILHPSYFVYHDNYNDDWALDYSYNTHAEDALFRRQDPAMEGEYLGNTENGNCIVTLS